MINLVEKEIIIKYIEVDPKIIKNWKIDHQVGIKKRRNHDQNQENILKKL